MSTGLYFVPLASGLYLKNLTDNFFQIFSILMGGGNVAKHWNVAGICHLWLPCFSLLYLCLQFDEVFMAF